MHILQLFLTLALVALFSGAAAASSLADTPDQTWLAYPAAHRGDVVDDYSGVKVADPYRWLEDTDSAETRAWVEAENRLTFDFLRSIPGRDAIRGRLTQLWDFERYGIPFKEGHRYFYRKNSGLQNQAVLYVADTLHGEPRVLIDPNKLSADGTVAVPETEPSNNGNLLAYSIANAGSDWQDWHVRSVETGKDLPDVLKWTKFTAASWAHDDSGFYYSRYAEPQAGQELQQQNYYQKLYFHRLGTPQAEDVLVYERPDEKEWGLYGGVTEDGRYLVITATRGTETKNRVFYEDISPSGPRAGAAGHVIELLGAGDARYSFIGNDGPTFWFLTDKDASRRRVIEIDIRHPQQHVELIPEAADSLSDVSVVGDRFIATYLKDASTRIRTFDLHGKPQGDVELPGLGTAGGFGGKRKDHETFYSYTSFTTPQTIYRLDVRSLQSELFRRPSVPFDASKYEAEQVFLSSKDGTRVPMFLVHKKGLRLDGANPTFLYGYGGFGVSVTPFYSPQIPVWLDMGGVYAVAVLRGGGEYGEEWHQAGTKANKHHVFEDFIAAAEWLISNRYTSTPKLAIGGGSNGGLLVGACMTQRPDLFAAAVPEVGVLDMLRFNKFTIGWAWTTDYGSPENPEDFKALYAYSPLHNLKRGDCYPATLVLTSDHDDRVVPAHSFKFAATLQADQSCGNPVLIRIETRAGHGAGKPTSKTIEEAADKWAFLTRVLGVSVPGAWAAAQ